MGRFLAKRVDLRNTCGLRHAIASTSRQNPSSKNPNNFSTNILLIPTNELKEEFIQVTENEGSCLKEEVKSQKMNVVVLKKCQPKLYVDQPLEDVESALPTFIYNKKVNKL
ncbi:hypothetical protein HanPI659440_Chr05g0202681 [Helianthus annuus]|nr:hypothetical protein HanPI659440_Chr05g0202681 [Helianthus annuus]